MKNKIIRCLQKRFEAFYLILHALVDILLGQIPRIPTAKQQ